MGALLQLLFLVLFVILPIAGMWTSFEKAGEPGWAAIVPIYNLVVVLKIAKLPMWWLLLLFIPLVNFIAIFLIFINFAKQFNKGAGFGIGLVLLSFIFFPLLGFGDAEYKG